LTVAPVREVPFDFAGIVHAGETGSPEEFAYLNRLGVDWVLHTFYWNSIEATQGEMNFAYYDSIVDKAGDAGIKTIGILAYDAAWIHDDNETHFYIPPERIPDYLAYVRQTVRHFRGRVAAWCIWNEPNHIFWTGTAGEFYELSRRAADAVREVDGDVILLGGAFNRGVFGLEKKFINGFFESGAAEKLDGLAFHPYDLTPARSARLYDEFKQLAAAYGFGDKIWITEMGFPTGGWYPTRVSEKKFPAHIVKTFTLLTIRETQKVIWYQLFDPVERKTGSSEDFFGLARSTNDYTSKGAEAFRLCAEYIAGRTYNAQKSRWDGLPDSVAAFYFEGSTENTLILWNEAPGAKQVRIALAGTGHTLHDPVTGNTSAISGETTVGVGAMPLVITWNGAVLSGE
jgi:hypothetical protein